MPGSIRYRSRKGNQPKECFWRYAEASLSWRLDKRWIVIAYASLPLRSKGGKPQRILRREGEWTAGD